ncbi:MAG: DUF3080 domain-containing protein [Alteromonas sp.]|nr:hypothetical protein [Alteromonadaceae bacterium]MCP4866828.1 DUF3080 domain-containing protein [Alteromonas sp.]
MQESGWQQRARGMLYSLALLVCITACSPHQVNDDISEYSERLGRVLDTELTTAEVQPAIAYPQRELLLSAPAQLDINLTRFYQLQQCELGNLVAERNTALGKIQHYSQRLVYERQLLAALADCITFVSQQNDETASELLAAMENWYVAKQAAYPEHWSNMLVLSDETRSAFSRPQPAQLFTDTLDIAGQLTLFRQLDSYLSPGADTEASLEEQLQGIGATRLPASVWQAQHQIATRLPTLTAQLDPLLANTACPDGSATAQANILRNVFYLFFIERIQPLGGHINDFNYQFAPLLNKWREEAALPESFRAFLTAQQARFNAYQQAMQDHVKLWQRFLGRCHLSPTAPG